MGPTVSLNWFDSVPKIMRKALLLGLLLLLLVPVADAAPRTQAAGAGNEVCRAFQVQKIVGVVESGNIISCTSIPVAVVEGRTFVMTGTVSTPLLGVGQTLDVVFVPGALTACTQQANIVGTNTVVTGGAIRTESFTMDMGMGRACYGHLAFTVVGPGGTLYTQFIAFHIERNIGSVFEELTGQTGLEFIAFFSIILMGLILWVKMKDEVVRYTASVVVMVPGIAWLGIFSTQPWGGSMALAVLALSLGGYMLVRTSIDLFSEG